MTSKVEQVGCFANTYYRFDDTQPWVNVKSVWTCQSSEYNGEKPGSDPSGRIISPSAPGVSYAGAKKPIYIPPVVKPIAIPDPIPGAYTRKISEGIKFIDQKEERVLSTAFLSPGKLGEKYDSGSHWSNVRGVIGDGQPASIKNGIITTKLFASEFPAVVPEGATITGFTIEIDRSGADSVTTEQVSVEVCNWQPTIVADTGDDGTLYTIGGDNIVSPYLNSVYKHDEGLDSWSSRTSLSSGRAWSSAASLEGKGYSIAGAPYSTDPVINAIDEYDQDLNSWTSKTGLPAYPGDVSYAGFAQLQTSNHAGDIHALCGRAWKATPTSVIIDTHRSWNKIDDGWTERTDYPYTQSNLNTTAGASEIDGSLYVCGENQEFASYLIGTDTFSAETASGNSNLVSFTRFQEKGHAMHLSPGNDDYLVSANYDVDLNSWTFEHNLTRAEESGESIFAQEIKSNVAEEMSWDLHFVSATGNCLLSGYDGSAWSNYTDHPVNFFRRSSMMRVR